MNTAGKRTDRGWKFNDLYTFRVISHSTTDLDKVRDDYLGAFKPQAPGAPHSSGLGTVSAGTQQAPANGITVKIAATHAGLITRNNGLYMPDKMRAAVSTWTEHYPKPVQIHHNDSPGDSHDPIGRIIAARYVDTTGPVTEQFQNSVLRDSYNKDVGKADKKFWDAFNSDKTSFIKKLDMLKLMDSVLNDPHYHGVGYIELTANITDPVAIPKILDGRYITGSVGAVSDKAVCSVCNTDWLEEEHCGHRPGRIYDGKKCVVVAGNLEYDEYSFVNTPADRHSGIMNIQNSVITDSADRTIKFFPVFEKMEDSTNMNEETPITQPEITQAATVEAKPEVQDAAVAATTTSDASPVPELQAAAAAAEAAAVEEPSELDKLFDKLFGGTALTDEEQDKLYEFQLSEMDKEVIEDAKLSTAKRKKLASSTFCGPGRSFPVPDCAHVTAARRLIGRYKGDKSGILACVSRKAKAMGCGGAKDAVVKDNVQETVQVQETVIEQPQFQVSVTYQDGIATDESKAKYAKMVVDSIVEKIGKDHVAKAVLDAGLAADPSEVTSLVDEVTKYEEIVGDLRDQLAALRKELKAAYEDLIVVEDQLIASKESTRSSKLENIKLFHKLDGSLTDDVNKNLETLSDDNLDVTLSTLSTKFDTEKIADRLNSGLSRTPEEIIVPAGLTEPSAETQSTTKPTYATQSIVDNVYRKVFLKDPASAKAYYDEMVKRGLAAPK